MDKNTKLLHQIREIIWPGGQHQSLREAVKEGYRPVDTLHRDLDNYDQIVGILLDADLGPTEEG